MTDRKSKPTNAVSRRAMLSMAPMPLFGAAAADAALPQRVGDVPAGALFSQLRLGDTMIDADLVRTSGFGGPGEGAAYYIYDAGVDAAFVAANPRTSFISGGRRGFRLDPQQRLTIQMFGGKADGTPSLGSGAIGGTYGATDNSLALNAAIAFLSANDVATGSNLFYRGGANIHFPAADGVYDHQSTVELKATVRLTGDGTGTTGGISPTILRWRPGMHGIIVHEYNTSGSGTVANGTYAGGGSILQGLQFVQHGTGNDKATEDYHALWLRARASILDCGFTGWSGNGVHILASAGAGGANEGNANYFHVERCFFIDCDHGMFIDGGDANAGYTLGCDFSSNRGYGLWDNSFLGNLHMGHHTQDNGLAYRNPDSASSTAWFGGNVYHAVPGQNLPTRQATQPGTNKAVWRLLERAGTASATLYPAWTPGNSYPWRDGGGYCADSTGGLGGLFVNCYSEGGQGGNYGLAPWRAIQGDHYYHWYGGIEWDHSHNGYLASNNGVKSDMGGLGATYLGSSFNSQGELLTYTESTRTGANRLHLAPAGINGQFNWKDLVFTKGNPANNRWAFRITTPNTDETFGRSTTQPLVLTATEIAIGDRIHQSGAAAPTMGHYAKGEVCWNDHSDPGQDRVDYWICKGAGSPGRWVARP